MAIDKDKVFELFGRYWEIAYNEGRTGEGFPDLANDVLAELRDALDADDGEVFTAMLVEIDGHAYGLRPGAARIVKEALADDPELDGTDFANPAWWRGEAYGSSAAIAAVTRILDGKDDGLGVANDEPWQSVRTRLREALRDAGRIGWIARMSKTSTVYMNNQHPWNVAGNYRFNNLRGQTFRDAIDAAMAKDGA